MFKIKYRFMFGFGSKKMGNQEPKKKTETEKQNKTGS